MISVDISELFKNWKKKCEKSFDAIDRREEE